VAEPGLHIVIPFLERIAFALCLKEDTLKIAPQHAITKDNVQVQLDGMVYFQGPKNFWLYASLGNSGGPLQGRVRYRPAYCCHKQFGAERHAQGKVPLLSCASDFLAQEVGKLDLDDLLHKRSTVNNAIDTNLREVCEKVALQACAC
jgi:regulator of protease activity HflC (stomatin/prohibitin superfamily)